MSLYQDLSDKIIRVYFNVLDYLGKGLAEKVYENALCIEFDEMGLSYERQKPLTVEYKGHIIGNYVADIFLEGKLILVLKAVATTTNEHVAQTLNHINLTHSQVGYILNFSQQEGRGFKRLLGQAALPPKT